MDKEERAIAEYREYKPLDLHLEGQEATPAPNWTFHTGLASAGTSGLVKLVNGHPDCLVLPEGLLWVYTDMLNLPSFRPTSQSYAIDHAVMLEQAGFKQWPASRLRAFFEGIRQMIAPGIQLFGDKVTLYCEVLDDLQRVFPGCRLVHMVRDTWDNIASIYDAPWWQKGVAEKYGQLPPDEVTELAYRTVVNLLQQIPGHKRILADPSKENAIVVHFEDLAESLHETITGVLEFLELDIASYDWSVLDTVHYAGRVGRWKECQPVAKLRETMEASNG